MKANIHPTYHDKAKIECACGHSWEAGLTKESLRTEICSKCHPFWTGEQRIVDTEGRVERMMRRYSLGSTDKS